MDWTLLILLAALFLTFLAWSRVRRQTAEVGEAREEALRSKTYTLEPRETAFGRGFAVIAADGSRLDPEALSWSEYGIESVPVVGLEEHEAARRNPAFAVGRDVELVVESEAHDAAQTPPPSEASGEKASQRGHGLPVIAVWDAKMIIRAGRVPAAMARELARRLDAGEVGQCIVLWEELVADGENGRTGLLLLLIHQEIGVES